jgi:hypothetical protein
MKSLFKTVLAVLAFVATAASAYPQNLSADEIFLYGRREVDATSFEYCRYVGLNGSAIDRAIPGRVLLAATASSTTVTGTNAFANVAVGDLLEINVAGAVLYRTVDARASADSITVNALLSTAAVTARPFSYRKLQCGTADTSGAFPVAGAHSFTIQVILAQENSASTDYQIECRVAGPATAWSIVNGPNNDTGVFNDMWTTDLPFSECRVGVKVNTDDGDDLTTNAERFTVNVIRRF